ncbi:DUF4435 domain-containing protein [Flavobacterium sp.]|uniref:DUF4435 domain-containing protein n=1 Tax=Flavobacterium sp. TaxID=239 RepID=UPI003F6A20FE
MSDKIRRTPEAIIKSFEMDPDKKAIYVEGLTDRLFFEHLFSKIDNGQTIFFEIDSVEIPIDEGGNRSRLIEFAQKIENSTAKIKCFIDADFNRILNNENLNNAIILTDFRDLESYLYEHEYLNKFIKIGLKTDKITPEFLLNEFSKAKSIAILRLCSTEQKFDFPFQRINENFSRYYSPQTGLNIEKYKTALTQTAVKKPTKEDLDKAIIEANEKCENIDFRHLLHGKDIMEILKEIARYIGYRKDNIDLVFWMSFDSNNIDKYPALKQLEDFILT